MKVIYRHSPTVKIGGRTFFGVVLFAFLVVVSAAVGTAAGLLLVYSTDLPQVEELEQYRPSSVTELYDGQGRVIGTFALQRRVIASYDDYPEVLRSALVSIEDKDFYRHSGINIWRIVGAAYRDIESGGKVQGASTLTMQLARNLFLSPDRSFYRKVQEALLAIQMERRFTKPQIFTLYANQIFLGHGAYGYEAASEYYFSKPAKQLRLEEAALLAGLPKAPQYYSPINHPERALKRRNLVLKELAEALRKNPGWQLSIQGHTDNIGGDAHNQALSAQRAASVKNALIERYAIAPDRLTTAGFGASQPKAPNDTLEGRALNRRV